MKRTAGPTAALLTPANIRVDGVRLGEDDRVYIRRRLGEKLATLMKVLDGTLAPDSGTIIS